LAKAIFLYKKVEIILMCMHEYWGAHKHRFPHTRVLLQKTNDLKYFPQQQSL